MIIQIHETGLRIIKYYEFLQQYRPMLGSGENHQKVSVKNNQI